MILIALFLVDLVATIVVKKSTKNQKTSQKSVLNG